MFVIRMVKEKPAISSMPPMPQTTTAVVDVGVSNMGDVKREKVWTFNNVAQNHNTDKLLFSFVLHRMDVYFYGSGMNLMNII